MSNASTFGDTRLSDLSRNHTVLECHDSPTRFYLSTISFNNGNWEVRLKDGTVYVLGHSASLQLVRDRMATKRGYVDDLNSKAQPAPPRLPPSSSSRKEALGEAVLPLLNKHDTEYAAGFKEEIFRSLEMGITQDDVKRRLSMKTLPDGDTCWYYSRHGVTSKSYFVRLLEFAD